MLHKLRRSQTGQGPHCPLHRARHLLDTFLWGIFGAQAPKCATGQPATVPAVGDVIVEPLGTSTATISEAGAEELGD